MEKNAIKLSGQVSEFPLLEVLQFLEMTKKKGALQVSKPGVDRVEKPKPATLYLDDGRLIHAALNGNHGVGIFHAVMKMETGHFRFFPGMDAPQTSINKSLNILLMESQKRSDEIKHLDSRLPPEETVLFLVSDLKEVPPLNTFEWKIISMINGRRTIKRICEKTGDELAVKETLLELFFKGVIDISTTDTGWKILIPLPVPSSELKSDRPYPPLLRTNLLLKAVDGKLTLQELMDKLNMQQNDLIEDIKLLMDTRWIKFPSRQEKILTYLKHDI